MSALSEEHTGRTVELRHNHTFGTVDNESAFIGHVGDSSKVNVLNHGSKIFVVRVGTIEFEFRLEGHAVGKPAFKTLVNGVTRGINVVIEEFKHKVVASIRYREVFCKNFEETLVFSFFRRSVELEEVLK